MKFSIKISKKQRDSGGGERRKTDIGKHGILSTAALYS